MTVDRTPISELKLQGSPNLGRALKREKDARPLTADEQNEVRQLDELIQQAMKACRRGCTVRGKPNPAFNQLAQLVKTRAKLLAGKKVTDDTSPMAEINRLIERATNGPDQRPA